MLDKVGPLEDNAGDKITEGILMAEDHNQRHFNIKIKSDKIKVKQCRRDFR